jgi:hypothetical protein
MVGVQFEPLDNGLDYLESVVTSLQGTPSPTDLKYAVLHLAAGVEVLLKARLLNEDWRLVFRNEDEANEDALAAGSFKSVGVYEALRRLRRIGVRIAEEQELAVGRSYQRRNALQHFGLTDTAEAIKSSSAITLNFLISFIGHELLPDDPEVVLPVLDSLRAGLQAIEGFVEVRLDSLKSFLETLEVVVTCPSCAQPSFVPGMCDCRFCFFSATGTEAAEEYLWSVLGESAYEAAKGRTGWSLHICPECGEEALVGGVIDHRRPNTYWCCFTEGWALHYSEMNECERCGMLASFGVDDMILCDACIQYIVEQD